MVFCEGEVRGRWVRVNLSEDRRVSIISVIYQGKRLDGYPVVSHTMDLPAALRENTFANNKARFQIAPVIDSSTGLDAWVDITNMIGYFEDPDDKAKGINSVVYLRKDAPLLKRAHQTAKSEELSDAYWHFLSDDEIQVKH